MSKKNQKKDGLTEEEMQKALDESEGGLVPMDQVEEKAPVEKEPESNAPVVSHEGKTIMEQAADMALINAGKLKRA